MSLEVVMLSCNGVEVSSEHVIRSLHPSLEEHGFTIVRMAVSRHLLDDVFRRYVTLMHLRGSDVPYGVPGHPAYEVVRSVEFDALRKAVLQSAEDVLHLSLDPVRRTPFRSFVGHSYTTMAHSDSLYVEGTVYTAWTPLMRTSPCSGGLAYLVGSHRLDAAAVRAEVHRLSPCKKPMAITDDLNLVSRVTGLKWFIPTTSPGDIIIHGQGSIHSGIDTDIVRTSTDFRMVPKGCAQDPRWANHWSSDDGY